MRARNYVLIISYRIGDWCFD